jgi:hypothetical protein
MSEKPANDTNSIFAIETAEGSRWGVVANGGKLTVQYNASGSGWMYPLDLLNPLAANTWYHLTLRVDEQTGFRIEVRDREYSVLAQTYTRAMPAGKSWRFRAWTYSGLASLDNYTEQRHTGSDLLTVSAQYERLTVGGVVTTTSYYYLGGQRVAMRQGSSMYWLHGDHPLRCATGPSAWAARA